MLLGEIDFDLQGPQYLRLHRQHPPALGINGVLIAEEVENPVDYQQYGEDVSAAELRPDVLVYTTDFLEKEVEVVGPVKLVLHPPNP